MCLSAPSEIGGEEKGAESGGEHEGEEGETPEGEVSIHTQLAVAFGATYAPLWSGTAYRHHGDMKSVSIALPLPSIDKSETAKEHVFCVTLNLLLN